MRHLYIFFVLVSFSLAEAQFTVQSITPANNSTNIPLTTTVSVTFSAALDTTFQLGSNIGIFWNLDGSPVRHYSPDLRTVSFDVTLLPSKVYVFCLYFARAQGGATLQLPNGVMFTTGSSFPPYTVSGDVRGGGTGVSPAHALVLLSATPLTEGSPDAVSGAIADGDGGYVLPYVANGTYYPVAARDVDANGVIEPGTVDVIAMGDPVTINNANLSGVNLTFITIPHMALATAITIADSISATLPADKSLRNLAGDGIDTVGTAIGWEFDYLRNSGTEGYRVRVSGMERHCENVDSQSCIWLGQVRPLANPGSSANPSIFLTNIENNGGREFRSQNPGSNLRFNCQVNVGDLRYSNFGWLVIDTSQNYWGARYSFGYDSTQQWVNVISRDYLGNYSTGSILLIAGVKPGDNGNRPFEFALSQNYPNPFNPSTQIRFSVPKDEWTTLKVYNLIGQEVATLVRGNVQAGQYTIRFDGGNLASGMYFYRLVSGTHVLTNRMIMMK